RYWNKPFRSDSLGTEDFVPVRCEQHETGETTEDRMSSAVVTGSTGHEVAGEDVHPDREAMSPGGFAPHADHEIVGAGVSSVTAVAIAAPGQPAQCDIEPHITG